MLRPLPVPESFVMRCYVLSALFVVGALSGPLPAMAQRVSGGTIEGRVDRLESEMRAVQRKVFPGGAGQYVEPDNRPAPADVALPGSPTSPIADLTTRVDSLEGQLRGLTAEMESTAHRQQLLEGRIKALETAAAAAAATATPSEAFATDRAVDQPPLAQPPLTRPSSTGAKPGVAPPPPAPRAVTTDDPARAARVAAIERPDTGDVAEDTYLYGYRLWAAKLYPEAEAQFTTVTMKFPRHKRASYAQNLLGRAYLDDGKPSLASVAFLDSYKNWPEGDRAAESLYYLAQALVRLDKPAAQVCKVYGELMLRYAAKVEADPRMKAGVARGRAAAKCP